MTRVSRSKGQAMTEFIIVIPVFMLLIFGSIQIALIYSAKNTLEYAAFQAARLGAVNQAQYSSIRRGLIRGIAPLFTTSKDDAGVPSDIKSGISRGKLSAQHEVDEYMRIIRVNPRLVHMSTTSGFGESGDGPEGSLLPNDNLQFRTPDPVDGTTIQDANLLKIVVQYCMPLRVPLVNRLISSLSVLNNTKPASQYHPDETINDPRFADRNRAEVNRFAQSNAALASYDELCAGRGSDDRLNNRRGFILQAEAFVRMQSPVSEFDPDPSLGDQHCGGERMACL